MTSNQQPSSQTSPIEMSSYAEGGNQEYSTERALASTEPVIKGDKKDANGPYESTLPKDPNDSVNLSEISDAINDSSAGRLGQLTK